MNAVIEHKDQYMNYMKIEYNPREVTIIGTTNIHPLMFRNDIEKELEFECYKGPVIIKMGSISEFNFDGKKLILKETIND